MDYRTIPSLPMMIAEPQSNDVLSGRGKIINSHPGNVHFRTIVNRLKFEYVMSRKSDKKVFANVIVESIRSLNPPGRFLKQDKETGQWYDIGEKLTLAKTRQALREGAPVIEKWVQKKKEQQKQQQQQQQEEEREQQEQNHQLPQEEHQHVELSQSAHEQVQGHNPLTMTMPQLPGKSCSCSKPFTSNHSFATFRPLKTKRNSFNASVA